VPPGKHYNLHNFWDSNPVAALFPGNISALEKSERKTEMNAAERNIVHTCASQEPKNWRLPASVPLKDYAEAWANEILPIAREAHQRLEFQGMTVAVQEDGSSLAKGTAVEKTMPDHLSYCDWSASVVAAELPKAGWRLADLLQKCLASTTASAAPSASPRASAATSPPVEPLAEVAATPLPPITPIPAPTPIPIATSIYGNFPANYKEVITAWLKTEFNNPTEPTIEWQTEPKPADLSGASGRKVYGYLVLFSTNGTSSPGARPSRHTRAVLIREGQVVIANGFDR